MSIAFGDRAKIPRYPRVKMSLRRTLAIARKEFRHIARDLRLLLLVTISPAFLLLTLAYVFSFDIKMVSLAVMDLDKSSLSRQYISTLTNNGDFRVVARAADYERLHSLLLRGDVDLVLVIPPGFGDAALGGQRAGLQAIVDGVDPISASRAIGDLAARTRAFALQLKPPSSQAPVAPLEVYSQAWYNPGLKSLFSMVPGLMAVVLCVPALAVALAVTREKEMGTFEKLIVTPVLGLEYLLGKLVTYVASGLVSLLLTTLVAVLWFRVPLRGSFLSLLLLAVDYFLASMGLSLLVAHFTSSQQAAFVIVLFVFFVPSFFISGLILPVEADSWRAQITAYSLPTTHFITICRDLFLKGSRLGDLWQPILALASLGSAAVTLSVLLFKKRMG